MFNLLSFRNEKLQTIPIGIVGALLMFLIILGVEGIVGVVYMLLTEYVLMDQPIWQSVVFNVGSFIGKIGVTATLFSVYVFQSHPNKLGRYRKKMALIHDESIDSEVIESKMAQVLSNPFLGALKPTKILGALPYILLLTLSYRLAFDSMFGEILQQYFPMDDDLIKAFEYIFEVPLLGILSVVIAAPVFEELFFRGFMMNGLRRKGYGVMTTAFITAGLFAVMHFNVLQGVNAFLLGLGLAFLYEKTNDLRVPIALHLLNNLLAVIYEPVLEWILLQSVVFRGCATMLGISLVFASLVLLNRYFDKHQQIKELKLEEVI